MSTWQELRAIYVWHDNQHVLEVQHGTPTRWRRKQPRWDGGTVGGRKFEPIWPQVHQELCDGNLPAFTIIQEAFRLSAFTPPDPDELGSCFDPADFASRFISVCEHSRNRLRSQIQRFEVELDPDIGEGPEVELTDDDRFTPLFQYAFSLTHLNQEIADMFLRSAVHDYIQNPDVYDHAWIKFLPPTFRQRAFEIAGICTPDVAAK